MTTRRRAATTDDAGNGVSRFATPASAIFLPFASRSAAQRRSDERSNLRCRCAALRQLQRGFSTDDERAYEHRSRSVAERVAQRDDFDDDDEPRTARRRAIARGGSRVGATNRVRPRSGLAAWPACRRFAAPHARARTARAARSAEPRSRGPRPPQPHLGRHHGAMHARSRVVTAADRTYAYSALIVHSVHDFADSAAGQAPRESAR